MEFDKDFLERVIVDAQIGLWEWDIALGNVIWSAQVRSLFDNDEFDGSLDGYFKCIHPHDAERLQVEIEKALALPDHVYHVVHRVVRNDHQPCWVECRGTVFRDEKGIPIKMGGTVWDVTPQLSAEHKLQMALSASSMGLWEWNIHAERVIWSKEIAAIYGVSLTDFTGTLEDYRSRIHPEDWGEIQERIEAAMADPDYEYFVEHRILRPDGAIRWVEGRGTLIRDEEGSPVRMMGTAWDVTNRHHAQEELARTQLELKRAYDRFNLAVDAAGIGVWDLAIDAGKLTWDERMHRIHGSQSAAFDDTWSTWQQCVHPEDQAAAQAAFQAAMDSGHGEAEYRVISFGHDVRYIKSFVRMSADHAGPKRLIGLCLDVTESRLAQLQERARRRVLEAMLSGDSLNRVLTVIVESLEEEEALARGSICLVDKTGESLTLQAAPSFPAEFLNSVEPLPIAEGNGSCGTAAFRRELVVAEDILVDPNWESYREMIQYGIRACWSQPIQASDGLILGTLAVYLEIPGKPSTESRRRMLQAADFAALAIERRRSEHALMKSESLLAAAGQIAGVGGWELDLATKHVSWTAETCRIHGVPVGFAPKLEEAVHFYAPEYREAIEQAVSRALEEGVPYDLELQLVTAQGKRIWVRTEGQAVFENGVPVRLFGAFQDISSRRDAELERQKLHEELLHSQKLESVGRLAGGVAHDFNNIVSVILGHAEFSLQHLESSSPLRAELEEIRNAARRSAALTQQLLAFARKQAVAPQVLELNETVDGMLKMLRRLIGEHINLVWKPQASVWPIKMDPSQVDQILANLCVNARDAIAGVGEIVIRTENVNLEQSDRDLPAGRFVLLSIEDDGQGIAQETLSHLFEPFFTTKSLGDGTGLGLATVYGIVKQNGGAIRVFSELGSGTVFQLYLPVFQGILDKEISHPSEEEVRGGGTVLLVEDEPALLKLCQRMLETLGYRVVSAPSPHDALKLADEEEEIHLLVTDVIMPHMNGRELATTLRQFHPGLKSLYISGYTAEVIAHQGVLEEDVHFLQKPFSLKDLSKSVSRALNEDGASEG